MNTEEKIQSMKKLVEELAGKTITLAPHESMFVERNGQYQLNAYKDQSSVVFEKGWLGYPTLLNIQAGVLRVFDGNTDVTVKFGGPAVAAVNRRVPLVQAAARIKEDNVLDKTLLKILDSIDEKKVVSAVNAARLSYTSLQRLLRFEKAGENPSFQPRRGIVDVLTTMIKNTKSPGQLVAERMPEDAAKA